MPEFVCLIGDAICVGSENMAWAGVVCFGSVVAVSGNGLRSESVSRPYFVVVVLSFCAMMARAKVVQS
jgi:hypothetical protein